MLRRTGVREGKASSGSGNLLPGNVHVNCPGVAPKLRGKNAFPGGNKLLLPHDDGAISRPLDRDRPHSASGLAARKLAHQAPERGRVPPGDLRFHVVGLAQQPEPTILLHHAGGGGGGPHKMPPSPGLPESVIGLDVHQQGRLDHELRPNGPRRQRSRPPLPDKESQQQPPATTAEAKCGAPRRGVPPQLGPSGRRDPVLGGGRTVLGGTSVA